MSSSNPPLVPVELQRDGDLRRWPVVGDDGVGEDARQEGDGQEEGDELPAGATSQPPGRRLPLPVRLPDGVALRRRTPR